MFGFDPLGQLRTDVTPVPRSAERVYAGEEIVEVIFHVEGDLVPPVRFVPAKVTVPYLLRFVRQLREQDAAARRAYRRLERKRVGGPRRLTSNHELP